MGKELSDEDKQKIRSVLLEEQADWLERAGRAESNDDLPSRHVALIVADALGDIAKKYSTRKLEGFGDGETPVGGSAIDLEAIEDQVAEEFGEIERYEPWDPEAIAYEKAVDAIPQQRSDSDAAYVSADDMRGPSFMHDAKGYRVL